MDAPHAALTTPDPPLAIDLDGTLCTTDTLIESLLRGLVNTPIALIGALAALSRSRAAFKARIAKLSPIEPATLVFNEAVLAQARAAKGAGRKIVLATASDRDTATRIAAHFPGLFDEILASDAMANLKGEAKAAGLVESFGQSGFDYIGDARADLPVFRAARKALVVAPSAALLAEARKIHPDAEIVPGPARHGRSGTILRALRVHQWAKNLLLFVPILAAHRADAHSCLTAALAVAAFSACASSVYLLNDLADLPHDRAHPTKRDRPFASGALKLQHGPALIAILLAITAILCALLPKPFFAMLAGYYACTLLYSFLLKRLMVADVMMLAGLYTIRVFAGGAATGTPVSPWLLAFSMFLFFCLAVVKRQTELVRLTRTPGHTNGVSAGRGYCAEDLDMLRSMAAASGYMAVLVLALYIDSADILPLYHHPRILWLLCPILLFWVSRVLMLSHRGEMNEDPVVFALRDRVSLLAGAASLAVVLIGTS